MGSWVADLLRVLLLTCALEAALLTLLRRKNRWLMASLACNLATNPIVNVLLLGAAHRGAVWYFCVLILLEFLVVAAEAGIYRLCTGDRVRRCLGTALACNGFSFAAGVFLDAVKTLG